MGVPISLTREHGAVGHKCVPVLTINVKRCPIAFVTCVSLITGGSEYLSMDFLATLAHSSVN